MKERKRKRKKERKREGERGNEMRERERDRERGTTFSKKIHDGFAKLPKVGSFPMLGSLSIVT